MNITGTTGAKGAAIDPCSATGYAEVMGDKKLQLVYQDVLDSFFQGRVVEVRNALREAGWEGEPYARSLRCGEYAVMFKPVQVGSGANVVGGAWKLLGGQDAVLRTIDEIPDKLTRSPSEFALDIGESMRQADIRLATNSLKEPQELSLEQFSEIATVKALVNHGRRWEVSFGNRSLGFCDSKTREGALREAHSDVVNNAICGNEPDAPEFLRTTFPPDHVLAEYPELQEKFASAIAAYKTQEKTRDIVQTISSFIDEHSDWWDSQLDSAESWRRKKELVGWRSDLNVPGHPEIAKKCLTTFVNFVEDGRIDWLNDGYEDCLENMLFSEAKMIIQPQIEVVPSKTAPLFTIGQKFNFNVGDQVVANGYRGSIAKVCDGQLSGMVEIRLPGGLVCNSACYPECFPAVTNGVEVVTDGRFVGKVMEVDNQFVVQSLGRGKLIAHQSWKFDVLPEKDTMVDLEHKGDKIMFMQLGKDQSEIGR